MAPRSSSQAINDQNESRLGGRLWARLPQIHDAAHATGTAPRSVCVASRVTTNSHGVRLPREEEPGGGHDQFHLDASAYKTLAAIHPSNHHSLVCYSQETFVSAPRSSIRAPSKHRQPLACSSVAHWRKTWPSAGSKFRLCYAPKAASTLARVIHCDAAIQGTRRSIFAFCC